MWAAGYSDEAGVQDVFQVITLLLDRGAHIDDAGQSRPHRADDRRRAQPSGRGLTSCSRAAQTRACSDKQGKSAADLTSLTALREKLDGDRNSG